MGMHDSLQFGLRKLLLWTAMVALWCGVFKTLSVGLSLLDPQTDPAISLTNMILIISWVAVVGIGRVVFRARVAAALAIVIGVIYAVLALWWSAHMSGRSLMALVSSYPDRATVAVAVLSVFGVIVFGCVEASFRTVNWLDKLMER